MDKKNEGKTTEQLIEEELNGNSGNPDSTKSSETKEAGETASPQTYTLPWLKDNEGNLKQLTAEQVVEEAQKQNTAYTLKSQELSDKTKTENHSQTPEDKKPVLTEKEQEVLADLKSKFGVVTKEDLEKVLSDKEKDIVNKSVRVSATQAQLNESLEQLEEDFDGSEDEVNGVKIPLPKVERQKVLDFIVKNPGTELTPLQIAKAVYQDQFISYESKKLAAGSTGKLPQTEKNGAEITEPPDTKPVSFRDGSAEKAVEQMVTA